MEELNFATFGTLNHERDCFLFACLFSAHKPGRVLLQFSIETGKNWDTKKNTGSFWTILVTRQALIVRFKSMALFMEIIAIASF